MDSNYRIASRRKTKPREIRLFRRILINASNWLWCSFCYIAQGGTDKCIWHKNFADGAAVPFLCLHHANMSTVREIQPCCVASRETVVYNCFPSCQSFPLVSRSFKTLNRHRLLWLFAIKLIHRCWIQSTDTKWEEKDSQRPWACRTWGPPSSTSQPPWHAPSS